MSSTAEQLDITDAIRVSGRRKLSLRPVDRLVVVEDGRANLFVQLADAEGRKRGYGRMLATLEAGAAMPLPSTAFEGMFLELVGVGEARVRLYDAETRNGFLAEAEDPAAAMAAGLDALLHSLSNGHMAPEAAFTFSAGEQAELLAGRHVSAASALWLVSAAEEEPADDDADSSPVLGLVGPGRDVVLSAGRKLSALTTPDFVGQHGWDPVDDWMSTEILEFARQVFDDFKKRDERVALRAESDGRQLNAALQRLPAIVDPSRAAAGATSPAGGLPGVIGLVCASQGIAFDSSIAASASDDMQEALQDLLRRSNLRFRKIALPDKWWDRDGLEMICFDVESGAAQAVLKRGAGRYEIVDPETGRRDPVTRSRAARIDEEAYVVFKPLPFRSLKAMDLVRHVLSGRAKFDMRWAAVLAVVTALIALLPPMLTGKLLNEVVPFAETESLVHLALGLVFIALGSAMFQLVRSIALLRVEAFADGALQAAVWDRLLRLPLTFFRRYEVGDLLIKATGPTQLRQAVSDTALSSALSAIFSIVNFGLMVSYDGTLALAALVFTLVTSLILLGLSRLQLRFERVQLKADAAVSSFILQVLAGIQKIRLMGAEDRAFARWLNKFADQRQHIVRAARIGNAIQTLSGVLPVIASIMFFYLVGQADSRISIGSFVAFNAAFGGFHGALLGLVNAISASLSAIPIYENMKPLLEEQPEIGPDRKPAPAFDGGIYMQNVFFRYDTDGPLILNGIDFRVEPGQFIAFVGPSGSGKSTIFRLLLGFETPEQGTVGYDGLDLSRLDLKTVRRQIGVVLQRGAILPGSIFENIVGSSPLTQEDAWEAARMAGFDEDIKHMPMGMHTVLTEGGGTLSGGQRQRLMIARAVVRKPRILLMDEATSALDNRTQAIVSESLSHLNATRIVIAHRLSTVINADRILVIDGGRIVQSGTYADLMEQDGPFRELARRQIA